MSSHVIRYDYLTFKKVKPSPIVKWEMSGSCGELTQSLDSKVTGIFILLEAPITPTDHTHVCAY